MKFYIPPNLQKDFSDSMLALGTDCIVNFVVGSKVRVRFDKVNYRVKNGVVSSDEVLFAELSSNLKMGDYLQYKEEILLINQVKVNQFPQCYEISVGNCNVKFDIKRYCAEEYNSDGVITNVAGNRDIAKSLYCVMTVGSYEFNAQSGAVGIIPTDVMGCQAQVNVNTKAIAEGDTFLWVNDKYEVISLDYSQVDLDGNDGVLTFYAKKVV